MPERPSVIPFERPDRPLTSADISQGRQRAEMCESVELTRDRYLELLALAEIGLMVRRGKSPCGAQTKPKR